MTFLNGILALGALAFTIPLAIHLMFRNRFRTVDWGAMHLLDSVVRINRRRIQLLHLLLLLLRCLLPILLALCLARPVMTGFHSLPGDAPRSLILVIDDSRSMATRDDSGVARIERAKQAVTDVLESLSRRDEVILLRCRSIDEVAGTMGVLDAVKKVRLLDASGGPVDLGQMVRAAVEACETASHSERQILVVSDFQSNLLEDSAIESLRRLGTALGNAKPRPTISLLDVSNDSSSLDNVSVESVSVESPAVIAGRTAKFSASLRNGSDNQVNDLRLVWSVDGTPLSPRSISIPPRSSISARMTHRIEEVGVHRLTVSVERADALLEDNERSIGVDVMKEVSVLIVDGQPSNRPLKGEADFLAIAPSPFAFGGEDQPDAVRTSVVMKQQFEQEIQKWKKEKPDVLVLANVDRLEASLRSSLAQFVSEGGSLVVFDGDHLDPEFYNEPWTYHGGQWQLPASLGAFQGALNSRAAVALPIGQVNPQYTPWQVLGAPDQDPFKDVEVYGYRKLNLDSFNPSPSDEINLDEDSDPIPVELLSMASGDPLVVLANRGQGKVVQFAVPCDADWTTLPMRLIYLPMIQQMVLDLAGSRKQPTVDVGSALVVPTTELTGLIPEDVRVDDERTHTYTVEIPGGLEQPIAPSDLALSQLQLDKTYHSGVYRFRQTTNLRGQADPLVTQTIRVVEVPAIESRLRDVEAERLIQAADSIGAEIYENVASMRSDDQTRRFGREIWRWLLFVLLVGMIGELLLQQRSLARTPALVKT